MTREGMQLLCCLPHAMMGPKEAVRATEIRAVLIPFRHRVVRPPQRDATRDT